MRSITLKNVPDPLYEQVKASAAANRRSLNSEILVCLERVLGARPADPAERLARIRAARRRVGDRPLTDHEVDAAKRAGRK